MKYILIINWHFIKDDTTNQFPSLIGPSESLFKRQLESLLTQYYPITIRQYVSFLQVNSPIPDRCCIITFDDGVIDCYKYALPIMAKLGAVGIFFLCSSTFTENRLLSVHMVNLLIEKLGLPVLIETFYRKLKDIYNNNIIRDNPERLGIKNIYPYDTGEKRKFKLDLNYRLPIEIRDTILNLIFEESYGKTEEFSKQLYMSLDMAKKLLKQGHELGTHTHSHSMLGRLSREDQLKEIKKSFDFVLDLTGKPEIAISYPYGMPGVYNDITFSILKELNILAGITMIRGFNYKTVKNIYELCRFDCVDVFNEEGKLKKDFIID